MAWEAVPGALYRLNLRAVNSTDTAPVIIDTTATQKLVQGLRPGSYYDVTLKALQHNTEQCRDTQRALTGEDAHTHTHMNTHTHTHMCTHTRTHAQTPHTILHLG